MRSLRELLGLMRTRRRRVCEALVPGKRPGQLEADGYAQGECDEGLSTLHLGTLREFIPLFPIHL